MIHVCSVTISCYEIRMITESIYISTDAAEIVQTRLKEGSSGYEYYVHYEGCKFTYNITVNSEIFTRVLFSQNLAKFGIREVLRKENLCEMAKSLCHLLMSVNHAQVAYFKSQIGLNFFTKKS